MVDEKDLHINGVYTHRRTWSSLNDSNPLRTFNFQWGTTHWNMLGECTLSQEDLDPVPLTQEILLVTSLSHTAEVLGARHYNYGKFSVRAVNGRLFIVTTNEIFNDLGQIQFLHQLQILHYSLTGKELNVDFLL